MINWILVLILPFAIILGMEFGRRKQIAAGEIYCFQPFWIYRNLSIILIASLTLFVEAARTSLTTPSPYHIWILILSATASLFVQLILSSNEMRYAKKQIAEHRFK
ncbi:MAG: hypothetical protein DHS20C08_18170 [Rhodomicrobium sp.]|nr:MAG: hypothetical protein DHS20C08_18170 [Rhodomicrobium sp.]